MISKNLVGLMAASTGRGVSSDMEAQAAAGQGADGTLCGGTARAFNSQCRLNGIPFGGGHVPGGLREQLEEQVGVPGSRIDAAINQIDELLWQGHTQDSLSDEQFERWNRFTDELESSCNELKTAVGD